MPAGVRSKTGLVGQRMKQKGAKMEYRGTGRTTQQMLAALHGAVFVWCNSNITYPNHYVVAP